MTPRLARRFPNHRRALSRGEHAALWGVIFLASLHAYTWALTLPDAGHIPAGIAGGLVIARILDWADGK